MGVPFIVGFTRLREDVIVNAQSSKTTAKNSAGKVTICPSEWAVTGKGRLRDLSKSDLLDLCQTLCENLDFDKNGKLYLSRNKVSC